MYSLVGACGSESDGSSDGVSNVSEEHDRGSGSNLDFDPTNSDVDSFGTKTVTVTNMSKSRHCRVRSACHG